MAKHEFMAGVTLTRSPLGGFAVEWGGKFVGWIHESGDRWNAYIRGAAEGDRGTGLGRYPKDEAVRKIVTAAGWPGPLREDLARRAS